MTVKKNTKGAAVKIKTADLTGAALNWAVGTLEGKRITLMRNSDGTLFQQPVWADGIEQLNYSTFWAQGGPIIEREDVLFTSTRANPSATRHFVAYLARSGTSGVRGEGPTHLIAAMRCYVASKLGDEVEIPEELM